MIAEALKVLSALNSQFSLNLTFEELNYNGTRYLETSEVISDEELNGLKSMMLFCWELLAILILSRVF